MQCIGATTLNEYRKYIEKDAALERRFQTVKVEAPSIEEAIQILKGLAPEIRRRITRPKFTDKALEAAVKLSDRYITGPFSAGQSDRRDGRSRLARPHRRHDAPAGGQGHRSARSKRSRREKEARDQGRRISKAPPPCATRKSRPRKSSNAFLTQWRDQREEKRVQRD